MDFIKRGIPTLSNKKTRHMSFSNLLRPSYIKVFRSYFNLLSFICFNTLSFTLNYSLYFDFLLITFIYILGRVCWSSVLLRGPRRTDLDENTIHGAFVYVFLWYTSGCLPIGRPVALGIGICIWNNGYMYVCVCIWRTYYVHVHEPRTISTSSVCTRTWTSYN